MDYKFKLTTSSQFHPIFQVSFLKKEIGDKIRVQTTLPELADEEGKPILDPERITIIETRTR